jgi:hypothetical protein
MAFHCPSRHTNTERATEGRWHQLSITARPYDGKKVEMCRYVSILRRSSGVNSGALISSYFTQSRKSSIWRLIGGHWLDGAHRSEQKHWTLWLTGCQLIDWHTNRLLDIGQTDWLLGLTPTRTHLFRNWVIPNEPQASDRITSMRQNIMSESETVMGKCQADLIKLTNGLTWKTHSVVSTGVLECWKNSIFIIYIRNVV